MSVGNKDTSEDKSEKTDRTKSEKQLAVRARVAAELVHTERAYCNSIRSIATEFLIPIRTEGILKKEYIETIFSNIDQLGNFHESVLEDLNECIQTWTNESNIGAVFMNLVPYLKLYKPYCAGYHEALLRVEERRENSSKFAAFLQSKAEQGLDLCSLLIRPIQRIPRYRLLFAELVKHTPKEHPDYQPVSEALLQIEDVAVYVNESVREKENQDKLLKIQQSLTGSKVPAIVNPKRKFIKEGVLVKMCRREPKRRYFFLFNDLLIYTTQQNEQSFAFHRAMTLDQLRVDNISDASAASGMRNAFQVLSNQKSFAVFAESSEDKEAWMKDINTAIQLNYQLKRGGRFTEGSTDVAPVWVPDKLLKNCMICDVKFTAINRRHHCRQCGKLLCGACSSKRFKLENIGKVCRVCDNCFDELSSPGTKKASTSSIPTPTCPQSQQELTEAQMTLARRATKKFGRNSTVIPNSSGAGSLLPAEKPSSLLAVSAPNPVAVEAVEKHKSRSRRTTSSQRKPRVTRTKKPSRVEKNTLSQLSDTLTEESSEDYDYLEEFEDIPLPNFAPPLPPNEDPWDDDSDDSSGYLSPPPDDPPFPPYLR